MKKQPSPELVLILLVILAILEIVAYLYVSKANVRGRVFEQQQKADISRDIDFMIVTRLYV